MGPDLPGGDLLLEPTESSEEGDEWCRRRAPLGFGMGLPVLEWPRLEAGLVALEGALDPDLDGEKRARLCEDGRGEGGGATELLRDLFPSSFASSVGTLFFF